MARPGEEQAAAGGVTGQPVPPRWSLRSRQEGTREPGSGAEPWSKGDRARTGLALLGHTWDTNHRCHTDLQRMSWQGQRACVGQEWLDKEKTSQEEKLELLERLRELERGSRSLLQQRLRVLQRLHGLLQRDKAETLRQLREALEQGRAGRRILREHLPSRPRDPAVPGRAGGSPGLGTPPRPSSAVGPGPSPAALGSSLPSPSRALIALRRLRQQIQRRLGQWQRLERALGAAGHRQEDGEQRQQPEKVPAPGAPREPLVQGQREHPHPSLALSSRGLLQQLQQHFQELQLEKTRDTGSPTALGDNRAPERSPGASPGWGLPLCHRPSADPRKGRGAELHHGAEFPVGTALRQVPPAPPHGTSDPRVTVGS
ncbi:uncharacterized protein LOC131585221 isoform X1 [Poecile atricapillus]|uniref:uncharacterized protein LOC131585221 isoform X1 n=1 Tax=Poecile atricapillus TaxID=48891 RepID=UPI002738A6D1|nr:uncharacterized protein LOC131585221 isoform X1 [Poecile atricapillus]